MSGKDVEITEVVPMTRYFCNRLGVLKQRLESTHQLPSVTYETSDASQIGIRHSVRCAAAA